MQIKKIITKKEQGHGNYESHPQKMDIALRKDFLWKLDTNSTTLSQLYNI